MSGGSWYCVVNGQKEGPYTVEALKEMAAVEPPPSDMLVWTEGMPNWAPLGTTPLSALLQGAVAPPGVPLGARVSAAAASMGATAAGTAPGFIDAVKICFAKYADFNGRASRPEYWWFALFNVLVGILLGWIPILGILLILALLLPSISVAVRRLHDTDRSGWWYLLIFLPIIGFLVLLWFFLQRGTDGPNRFG